MARRRRRQVVLISAGFCVLALFQNCSETLGPDLQNSAQASSIAPAADLGPAPTPAPTSNTWRVLVTTNTPPPRVGASVACAGDKVYIWGGFNSAGSVTAEGWELNLLTGEWVPLPVSPLAARADHSAIWTGNEMIVFGGTTSSGAVTPTATMAAYKPSTRAWTNLPAASIAARLGHSAVWTGQRMVVFGGRTASAPFTNSGGVYDPGSRTWSPTSMTGAPPARSHSLAAWTGAAVYVFGGLFPAGSAWTSAMYNPLNNTWTTVPGVADRNYGASAFFNDRLLFWGGTTTNNGYSVIASTGQFVPIANPSSPSRYGNVGCMTSQGFLSWGGTNGSQFFNETLLYRPTGFQ